MWQRRGGEEERRARTKHINGPNCTMGAQIGLRSLAVSGISPVWLWDREAGSVGEGWKRMGARRGVPGRDCGRLWGREHAAAGAGTASARPHAKPSTKQDIVMALIVARKRKVQNSKA